jgi:Fe-S-cluster containining protein
MKAGSKRVSGGDTQAMLQIKTAHEIETTHAEFGFKRTECACDECTLHCRVTPGYLVPSDIERISHNLGYTNLVRFAFENLLASPGATVMNSYTGRVFRIPTLVPQRAADDACKFLQKGRCAIHAVSPYGCAMFDSHQSSEEANRRSARGLQEIACEWAQGARSIYVCLWKMLDAAGLRAVPPEVARETNGGSGK